MSDTKDRDRRELIFSQRYGYNPLPEPMRIEELSKDLRRVIWNSTRELLIVMSNQSDKSYYFDGKSKLFIQRVLGAFFNIPEDDVVVYGRKYKSFALIFKQIILEHKFHAVLSFLELILKYHYVGDDFHNKIAFLFDQHAAAYWLDTSHRPYYFFPRSSKEQGRATQQAIETIRKEGMEGATTHLRDAAIHIKAEQYADSVVDSINAVESIARTIAPEASTLGKALNILMKKNLLTNNELKSGFEKLYAYSNSAAGGRHALVFKDSSDIDLDEAIFMFGACASFAAYLVSKQGKLGRTIPHPDPLSGGDGEMGSSHNRADF